MAEGGILRKEDIVDLLAGPLEVYSERLLRIILKKGGVPEPFIFNRAQRYLHREIEKQKEELKMVRLLVLKGRKQGVSTYTAGRFFRRTTTVAGTETFILSHEEKSTTTLFNMPKRFYNNLPIELRVEVGRDNDQILTFPGLDSAYSVGTAGSKETGRSKTPQLFHGSEVALWKNGDDHSAGVINAVPDEPGTEVILESTARGIGNFFHKRWLDAVSGKGIYRAVFIPWFWQEEYTMQPMPGWQPSGEELDYAVQYGLTLHQSYWMHQKQIGMGGDVGKIAWRFKQEYPGNAVEAFQGGAEGAYIQAEIVHNARIAKDIFPTNDDAKILGVDCARNPGLGDKTVLLDRWGRVAGSLVHWSRTTENVTMIVGQIVHEHRKHNFDMIFIDVGNCGAGVYDRLVEAGYGARVRAVNFGEAATEVEVYANKRAEMYGRAKEWFNLAGGVRIPENAELLHSQVSAIGHRFDARNRLIMELKDKVKERIGMSPDEADALVLTFAEHVVKPHTQSIILGDSYGYGREMEPASWMGL